MIKQRTIATPPLHTNRSAPPPVVFSSCAAEGYPIRQPQHRSTLASTAAKQRQRTPLAQAAALPQLLGQIKAAAQLLRDVIQVTPLTAAPSLSALTGGPVYLKEEYRQVTGCCKARSAFYMLATLATEQKQQGVVTVSTGNNGIAMAWAMQQLGVSGVVFLPRTVTAHKVQAIRRSGIEIIFHGDDIVDAEIAARAHAAQTGATFLSPYNEWGAIYGQGTVAAEIVQQMAMLDQQVDIMLVPVGGGGLISGIAGYFKATNAGTQIIGVQPAHSAVMAHSVQAGRILEMASRPTLSDATAGGVEQGAITFNFCRRLVDDYVVVEEQEIAAAMRWLYTEHGIVVEGAGALAVAALLQQSERFVGKRVVLLLCGGNISAQQFSQVQQARIELTQVV